MQINSRGSRLTFALLLVTACGVGSRDQDSPNQGSGGVGAGGRSIGSGGVVAASGGIASGGIATGGSVGSGGLGSAGGSRASGGAPATGGTGAASTGGAVGAGGAIAKGGASGTGGAAGGAAGSAAKGGASGTGGTTSTSTLAKFSFFVTSYAALQKIANNTKGLGGDLRFGETGPGAGLRGADKICATIAEDSMAGASAKTWRAFLSATADENGKQVNAIERIGKGPWYDRLGRLFANNVDELFYDRPQNADAAIKMDFPNENGVTNHNPDKTGNVDNHDTLTGSDSQGKLYGATATCNDWTSTATTGSKPRVGHTWPTMASGCSTASTVGGSGAGGSPGGGGPGGGFGGIGSLCNWMSALDESGCAPGVNLAETGGPGNDGTVGSGGGYGGFYCFALTP